MRTAVRDDCVEYEVVDEKDAIIWKRIVWFGHDEAHRAGGQAFVEAAREQEKIAMERPRP